MGDGLPGPPPARAEFDVQQIKTQKRVSFLEGGDINAYFSKSSTLPHQELPKSSRSPQTLRYSCPP